MTLVSQIITDAFRKSNLVAVGATETSAEQTEALRYLNRLVKSVLGNEVGDPMMSFPLGNIGISRPAGYPWWGTTPDGDWFVPQNMRVILNIPSAINLYLHPEPDDGSRFAAVDVTGNLSSNPVTVSGNGRLIENATSITLNTDNLNREWFYRSDLAEWVRYAPLTVSDTFPFPEEFDNFFIIMLALEINPSQGTTIDGQTQVSLSRARTQLRARYKQNIPARSELGLLRMPLLSAERDSWRSDGWGDDTDAFNQGWPY